MLFDQPPMEPIVARRNRRMRRKDNLARYPPGGLVKVQTFFGHAIANGFQDGECAMPFIQVKHARRDAQSFQRSKASDAEQQFLPYPDATVAAIKTRRQIAIL